MMGQHVHLGSAARAHLIISSRRGPNRGGFSQLVGRLMVGGDCSLGGEARVVDPAGPGMVRVLEHGTDHPCLASLTFCSSQLLVNGVVSTTTGLSQLPATAADGGGGLGDGGCTSGVGGLGGGGLGGGGLGGRLGSGGLGEIAGQCILLLRTGASLFLGRDHQIRHSLR